jgi:hypothetical protein
MFCARTDWILSGFVPSLPCRQGGLEVRIHPIRDLREVLISPFREECREECKEIVCHPCRVRLACEPFLCKPERWCSRRGEPNINEILLRRAIAGVLTRLRSYDWQVIHGHYVGDNGNALDFFA